MLLYCKSRMGVQKLFLKGPYSGREHLPYKISDFCYPIHYPDQKMKADSEQMSEKKIRINRTEIVFQREPLIRPFGFKGGYMTEIWQTVILLKSENSHAIGLGTQNVLWSDADVFAGNSEMEANRLMFELSACAVERLKGAEFVNPLDFLRENFEAIHSEGIRLTGKQNLRKTFTLNALVPVDNALWTLYFRENGLTRFDQIIPEKCRPALSHRNKQVATIPLISYNVPVEEIRRIVDSGCFIMKIKIGQPGTQEEMLEKDMARLTEINDLIGNMRTPHTVDGRIPWYFDANGRYEKKETLVKLLEHAEKIGMLPQIAIVEEPFPEEADIDVHDLPVRLAADESAHTPEDAVERMNRGYKAIALKPAAKTLSISMLMAQAAYERNIPCFCADLTVNPILVDWNKSVAARLAPFPRLNTGLLETNGGQNYLNWMKMKAFLPNQKAGWVEAKDGLFDTGEEFFNENGGIFDDSRYYYQLMNG